MKKLKCFEMPREQGKCKMLMREKENEIEIFPAVNPDGTKAKTPKGAKWVDATYSSWGMEWR